MKLRRTSPTPLRYSTRVPPPGNDLRETCKIQTLGLHLFVCQLAGQLLRQWARVITYNRLQQWNSTVEISDRVMKAWCFQVHTGNKN